MSILPAGHKREHGLGVHSNAFVKDLMQASSIVSSTSARNSKPHCQQNRHSNLPHSSATHSRIPNVLDLQSSALLANRRRFRHSVHTARCRGDAVSWMFATGTPDHVRV